MQVPLGGGLPSHQLARPAEQHVHVGQNFSLPAFEDEERGKKISKGNE